jgi:DNA transformation protein
VNSYWELPARLFDDSEEFAQWARAALAAAQRAKVKKRPKKATVNKATVKKAAAKKVASKSSKPAKTPTKSPRYEGA